MRPLLRGRYALLLLLLPMPLALAQGKTGELTANFTPDGPAFSSLLLPELPPTDFELSLLVGYSNPGVILDTVGLNAAPVGAWAISVDAEGQLSFQVYDPGLQSPWRNPSGWHVLCSAEKVKAGSVALALLTVRGLDVAWAVDSQPPLTLRLARPLASSPVWVGDFPGDDHWGEGLNIHPAMTGRLLVQLKPPAAEPKPEEPKPEDPKPEDPVGDSEGELERVAAGVEQALKAADLPALLALTVAPQREALGGALEASREDMPKLGEWLARRKLLSQDATRAEYEVLVEEVRLSVRFVKSEERWWLLSL